MLFQGNIMKQFMKLRDALVIILFAILIYYISEYNVLNLLNPTSFAKLIIDIFASLISFVEVFVMFILLLAFFGCIFLAATESLIR